MEAILLNIIRKLLWFEITKMLIAPPNKNMGESIFLPPQSFSLCISYTPGKTLREGANFFMFVWLIQECNI